MDPWSTCVLIHVHEETLCFLYFKKSDKIPIDLPDIAFRFCFCIPCVKLCQELSSTRKALFTSNFSSKILCILWAMDKIWLIQKSASLKLDWFQEINLFSKGTLSFQQLLVSKVLFGDPKIVRRIGNFSLLLSPFLWIETTLAFSPF